MNGPPLEFYLAWTAGKIVIIGMVSEGPAAGGQVVCIAKRHEMMRGITRAKNSLGRFPGFLDSVRTTIHEQISRGFSRLNKRNDKNFMDDLAIMMAAKLATGREEVLDGSGLFSLMIAIDPDDTKPWTRRGMLAPLDDESGIPSL